MNKERRIEKKFKTAHITNTIFIFVMMLMAGLLAGVNISANNGEGNLEETQTPLPNPFGENPAVATDSEGNIHVAWRDMRHGDWDVFYANSTNDGESFGWNIRVNDNTEEQFRYDVDIAVDSDGNPHIVWAEAGKIYHAVCTNGLTFQSNIVYEHEGIFNVARGPSIAIDNSDNIHVAFLRWQEYQQTVSDWQIAYKKSTDNGASFGATVPVSDGTSWEKGIPSIDVDGNGNPYVVWSLKYQLYYDRIMFDKSTDGGVSFGQDAVVDNAGSVNSPRGHPDLGVYTGIIIDFTWQDKRDGEWHVWVARTNDGGSSFQHHKRIDDPGRQAVKPSLALLEGAPHVVWEESPYNFRIFQDYMRDYPTYEWGDDVQVSSSQDHNPAIATDTVNYYIHVTFDGDNRIWYAKSTDGGETFGQEVEVTGLSYNA